MADTDFPVGNYILGYVELPTFRAIEQSAAKTST